MIYLLSFLVTFTSFLSGQQDHFFKGNHLFEQGQYVQACKAYQTIESQGFSVLYNTALSYLHQGDQAHALLAIKRAEQEANFTQLGLLYELVDWIKLQNNPDYVVTLPAQLAIFCKKCILSISVGFLQLMILILLVGIIVAWYRRWYYTHVVTMGCFVILFIMIGQLVIYKLDLDQHKVGIVTKDAIFLYAGPHASFYKKGQLHGCDQVHIIDKNQKYYQIKTGKIIGWVSDDDIELVSTLK